MAHFAAQFVNRNTVNEPRCCVGVWFGVCGCFVWHIVFVKFHLSQTILYSEHINPKPFARQGGGLLSFMIPRSSSIWENFDYQIQYHLSKMMKIEYLGALLQRLFLCWKTQQVSALVITFKVKLALSHCETISRSLFLLTCLFLLCKTLMAYCSHCN